MEKICVYNFLDGNNLCNIFANLIVNKISELVPDSKTEITVVNVRNFFVVMGKTTSDVLINIAEIFQSFLNDYDEELSKKVRVFDIITYNSEIENIPLSMTLKRKKLVEGKKIEVQRILNEFAKNKLYFNIKMDSDFKIIYYDCNTEQISEVIKILEKEFPDFSLVKSDFSTEVYTSEKFYGTTSHNDKLYYLLLEHITNHLFMLGISSDTHIELSTDLNINELNNENINLSLQNGKYIVKTEWLESLLLDVFPFDRASLQEVFNDSENLIDYVMNRKDENISFNKLTKINDFVLL